MATGTKGFPSPLGDEVLKPFAKTFCISLMAIRCFRPLSGMRCLNHHQPKIFDDEETKKSFRPLSGMRYLNQPFFNRLADLIDPTWFPSPLGDEVLKPGD